MKALRSLAIAAAVLLGIAGYLHFVRDPWVRQVANLERQRDSLDLRVGVLRLDSAHQAREDRRLRDSVGVLLRLDRHDRVRVDTLRENADSIAAAVLASVADTLKPRIRAALAAKDTVIAVLLNQRAQLMGVIALQDRQISLRDTAIAGLRPALAEAIAQRDRYRALAHPGWFKELLRDIPKYVAGGGIVLLIHAL